MMRLQDVVSRKVYFPIIAGLIPTPANPVRWRVRGMVREREWLMRQPLADIRQHQAQRVHELLVHAVRHCEFYRRSFAAAGLTNERDLTVDNLELLPILSKHDIQRYYDSLLSAGMRRNTWRQNFSGGSTGQTVVLMQDAAYRAEDDATSFVSDRMQGWDFGKRLAQLWGGSNDTQTWKKGKVRLLSYLANSRLYNSFNMGSASMEGYHRDLEQYQPDNILAYAGSAYLFSRFLLEKRCKPNYPHVSIITSAETLSDEMRSTIEKCFSVPVYNRYGSREVGCIASECSRHAGLHMHIDKKIEVLDLHTNRPVFEKPGRVVVTLLSNRALPLIRYDLGDIGICSEVPCTCGVNAPLLRKVLGRSSDFILAPSGRLIHGEYFTHVFYGRHAIRQFQFVQESSQSYVVRIVSNERLTAAQLDDIRGQIISVLGDRADVRFEFPENIPSLPSGKFRFTISNVELSSAGFSACSKSV